MTRSDFMARVSNVWIKAIGNTESHRAHIMEHYRAVTVLAWAAPRETTYIQDQSYSISALTEAHPAVFYSEGVDAFRNFQECQADAQGHFHREDPTLLAWYDSDGMSLSPPFKAHARKVTMLIFSDISCRYQRRHGRPPSKLGSAAPSVDYFMKDLYTLDFFQHQYFHSLDISIHFHHPDPSIFTTAYSIKGSSVSAMVLDLGFNTLRKMHLGIVVAPAPTERYMRICHRRGLFWFEKMSSSYKSHVFFSRTLPQALTDVPGAGWQEIEWPGSGRFKLEWGPVICEPGGHRKMYRHCPLCDIRDGGDGEPLM